MSQAMFSLLIVLLFAGCGKKDSSSNGKKLVSLGPEQMEEILDRQEFSCRVSPSSCPFGIGRIFIINVSDTSSSAVCTGFLVSSKRMVTNHHCISSEEECANSYISIRTETGPAKARCKTVEFTHEDSPDPNTKSTDLTIFELDREISSTYFKVSPIRPATGKNLIAWVVDQVSYTEAIVTRLDCMYETKDASMVLRNCPAISGNSGSPLIQGSTGEVVGILWGSSLPPTVDASFPFDLREALAAISVATELIPYRRRLSGEDSSLR